MVIDTWLYFNLGAVVDAVIGARVTKGYIVEKKVQQNFIAIGCVKALNGAWVDYICNKLHMIDIYVPT